MTPKCSAGEKGRQDEPPLWVLPLLFHGTRHRFRQFRAGEEGIFFCESADMAAWYAHAAEGDQHGRVIAAYVDAKNPLTMTWREYTRGVTDSGINHYLEGNEGLAARGYDGLILTDPDEADPAMASVTHVAFCPDQITVISWDWEREAPAQGGRRRPAGGQGWADEGPGV